MIDSDTLLTKLRDAIADKRRDHVQLVLRGTPTWDAYKEAVGYISALEFVLAEIPRLTQPDEEPSAAEENDGWNE